MLVVKVIAPVLGAIRRSVSFAGILENPLTSSVPYTRERLIKAGPRLLAEMIVTHLAPKFDLTVNHDDKDRSLAKFHELMLPENGQKFPFDETFGKKPKKIGETYFHMVRYVDHLKGNRASTNEQRLQRAREIAFFFLNWANWHLEDRALSADDSASDKIKVVNAIPDDLFYKLTIDITRTCSSHKKLDAYRPSPLEPDETLKFVFALKGMRDQHFLHVLRWSKDETDKTLSRGISECLDNTVKNVYAKLDKAAKEAPTARGSAGDEELDGGGFFDFLD